MRKELRKILVTGGAGFIGSEFVRQGVERGCKIAVVDKLTYAGDLARLASVNGKYKFYKADVCDKTAMDKIFKAEKPDAIVHFAAESHVDRSILDGTVFLESNIIGTQVLMDVSRQYGIKKFVHVSTDEVYGDIKKGKFRENSPIKPNSPYAVSKAAADLLVQAYVRTYRFPAVIVRASNNYGPWQYPEKFMPVIFAKAFANKPVPVYARGQNKREWLYVSDCVKGIFTVLEKGKLGQAYNLGSGKEKKNIEVVRFLLAILGKSAKLIKFVADRPGHDIRYSLDSTKLRELGWQPETEFEPGAVATVVWYQLQESWLNKKISAVKKYWKKVYREA